MNLIRVDLRQFSGIICDFTITEDNTILFVKALGKYRSGSDGNCDGLYLFSVLVAYYFVYEPISMILDVRDLEYSWGNTILKSLNFFNEVARDNDEKNKVIIIIHSDENQQAITGVLKMLKDGKQILCKDPDEAFGIAIEKVQKYLDNR